MGLKVREPQLYEKSCRGKLYELTRVFHHSFPTLPQTYIPNGGRYFGRHEEGVQATLSYYKSEEGRPYNLLRDYFQNLMPKSTTTYEPKGIEAVAWLHVLGTMRVPPEVRPSTLASTCIAFVFPDRSSFVVHHS